MLEKPVYVTPNGKVELEEELEHLRNVERPRIIEALHEVKNGADWMENTEQMMFEDELSFVDRRIQDIEGMLADSKIIEPDEDNTVVNIGDTVVIRDEDGEEETYTIVGVAEADPSKGLISNESPMGKALLTQRVGKSVTFTAPVGEMKFHIVGVK
jgi:transcription elongation factor GreA